MLIKEGSAHGEQQSTKAAAKGQALHASRHQSDAGPVATGTPGSCPHSLQLPS